MGESSAGTTLTFRTPDGVPFAAYVAGDKQASQAVLILHEWWGLKDHNRGWADHFARAGYWALAIDLYDGRVTDDRQVAAGWMRELNQVQADAKLATALEVLALHGRPVATFGFSLGGRESFAATFLRPELVGATVVGYCRMPAEVEALRALHGPVLAIYAERERTWPEKQQAFEAAMAAAGRVTESLRFDAAHGFMDPDSPNFDPAASDATWQATLAFLQRHMQ
jgi:carboxymethylenebutenolidase